MYHRVGDARRARRAVDMPLGLDPEAAARLALTRVRKLVGAYSPGMAFDRARLQADLAVALAAPEQEAERLFALGWLRWVEGDPVAADPLFGEAGPQAQQVKTPLVAGPGPLGPPARGWGGGARGGGRDLGGVWPP